MKALDLFHNLSNLKINFGKSTALNVTLEADLVRHCESVFFFCWQLKSMTYLGIHLSSSLDDLYVLNYAPLLRSITSDLQQWSKTPLSSSGFEDDCAVEDPLRASDHIDYYALGLLCLPLETICGIYLGKGLLSH